MKSLGQIGAALGVVAAAALLPFAALAADPHVAKSKPMPLVPAASHAPKTDHEPAKSPAPAKTHAAAKKPAPTLAPLAPVRTATPGKDGPTTAKADTERHVPAASGPHAAHWSYEGDGGPAHWGDLKAEYKACGAGREQSPIDIDAAGAARMTPLSFHYKVSVIEMVNNGHTVQASYGAGSYITLGGERFDLLQFHFHTPSEHRVAGRSFPMEIHFVHRNKQGRLAVVGVLIAAGEASLAARELWDRLPAAPNSKSSDTRALINARDLMPAGANYFRYSGSLTTPPCSEQVDWFVLQKPITFSIDQIARIRGIMGINARPVQARNGRYLLQGIDG